MTKHVLLASVFSLAASIGVAHAGWSGLYIGAHAGGVWGDTDVTTLSHVGQNGFWEILNGGSFTVEREGVLGGAQIGYDFQFSSWVFGLEISGSATDLDETIFLTTDDEYSVESNWMANASLRAGFLVRPTSLLYLKGGYVVGDVQTREVDTGGVLLGRFVTEETHNGWLAGAGFEEMISPDVSVAVEYNYVDLGNQDHRGVVFAPAGGVIVNDVDVQLHSVTARLNWHFWSP